MRSDRRAPLEDLRSLTPDEVRPFDRRRSGLLLGEAGALALLVRERDLRGPPPANRTPSVSFIALLVG